MKKILKWVLLLQCIITAALPLAALNQSDLIRADELFSSNQDTEGMTLISDLLNTNPDDHDKSELLWRKAQFTHELTSKAKSAGLSKEEILAMYEEGMAYASEAIELNADSAWAYYWRATNMGSWGSTKGIVDSLGSLGDMKDDLHACLEIDPAHGDAWSVLAIINADVPSILGGSIDKAVSQDRKAASLWNGRGLPNLEVFGELANHLIRRNWDASKRNKKLASKSKNYSRADDIFEQAEYYEGFISFNEKTAYSNKSLSSMSDKEEAEELLTWLISKLEALSSPNDFHLSKMEGFQQKLSEL